MKEPGLSERAKRALDFRQTAVKLVANTMYGYTAASFSGRMPMSELACAIVADSRLCTEIAIEHVKKEYDLTTVYGDTDSLFVDLKKDLTKDNLVDAIQLAKNIAKKITKIFPPPIQLKYEKVYWPCILESKKRYFGLVWEEKYEDKKFPFEAKGIETVRRDGVKATSKLLIQAAKILFKSAMEHDKTSFSGQGQKIISLLTNEFTKMLADPPRHTYNVMFSKGWRGLGGYADGSKVGPLKIAQIMSEIDVDLIPKSSSRIPYGIRQQNTVYDEESLFNRTRPMIEFVHGKQVPDIKYYLEKQIGPAINRFTGVVTNLNVDIDRIIAEAENDAKSAADYVNGTTCLRCKESIEPNIFVCVNCRTRENEHVLESVAQQYDKDFNLCFEKV